MLLLFLMLSSSRNGRDRIIGLYRPFWRPLSPAPLRAVSVNAAKALMDIFPIKYKEENRLRIEGADGNVIFNVIVPTNPLKDEQKEEE